jgi:hypothetical protein
MKIIGLFTIWLVFQNLLTLGNYDDAKTKVKISNISYNDDPDGKKYFTYDAEGRLTSCVTGVDSVLFVYYSDSIIQYNRHPDKFWEYKTSFVLDASGKAVNARTFDGYANRVREENYTYDEKERLTYYYRYIYANNEVWQYHFDYLNDSVTKVSTMLPDGSAGNSYTLLYNRHQPNVFQPTFVGSWFDAGPIKLFGQEPAFLPQAILCTGPNGDTLSHINYCYPSSKNELIFTVSETDVLNQFTNTITCHSD